MIMNEDDKKKIELIELIDSAFNSMSLEEIQILFGGEKIIEKLKGSESEVGPLMSAYIEIEKLRSDLQELQTDIRSLVKSMHAHTTPIYNPDLTLLKSKYGTY